MWEKIKGHFKGFPAQEKVALTMILQGLRVDADGTVYSGNIGVSSAKFARAIGVDRRAITATAKTLTENEVLFNIFSKLKPACDLSDVGKALGLGVIELKADARASGILAQVAEIIAAQDVSIRQIIADDPYLVPDPKAVIITSDPLPGDLVNRLLAVPGILEVTIK